MCPCFLHSTLNVSPILYVNILIFIECGEGQYRNHFFFPIRYLLRIITHVVLTLFQNSFFVTGGKIMKIIKMFAHTRI